MSGLRFECQPGCTACCQRKGFVYLTEDDIARAARFLDMTGRGIRKTLHLPNQESAPPAHTARRAMPVSARGWLLDSSRQADAVPHLSVLAGVGGKRAASGARPRPGVRASARASWCRSKRCGRWRGRCARPIRLCIRNDIGRLHGEEFQGAVRARDPGAGHFARRGRWPHLRRLRGRLARDLSGHRGNVRGDAGAGKRASPRPDRYVPAALWRAYPADPPAGCKRLRHTPAGVAGAAAGYQRGAQAGRNHGTGNPPVL